MKRTHAKRLLKLVERLRSVRRSQFDLSTWATVPFADPSLKKAPDPDASGIYNRQRCGTAACAVGWACTIPAFKRAGLRLKLSTCSDFPSPQYKSLGGLNAAKAFFGLTEAEAMELFLPEYYSVANPTPKQVAARIEKLVGKYHPNLTTEPAK